MKTVLITGASRGIGAETARVFAEHRGEYSVIINYNKSAGEAKALAEETGGYPIKADISVPEQVESMIDKIEDKFGGVDILINNAGISKFNLFTDITEEEWSEVMEVNLNGPYRVTRGVVRHMINNHFGSIINISSMWGVVGSSCEVAYSSAKSGLIGMTKALAKELGPSNIRVNCIAPGVIDTDMNAGLDENTVRELISETPVMRIGKPRDVGELAYFLSGSGAEFITGQVIGVNGGFVV